MFDLVGNPEDRFSCDGAHMIEQNDLVVCQISPSTLCSSGVIVAHLIPTLYFLMASAESMVT